MQVNLGLCVLIGCCLIYSVGKRHFRNDYNYNSEAGGWMKFHRIPANFNEARLRCQFEGAVLASPIFKELNQAMTTLMSENQLATQVFTGIHATFSSGDFVSIEGIHISKITQNWAVNEPNNLNDQEKCIALGADGFISDVKCSNVYPYMCYKKHKIMTVSECGTTDPEYKLDARTGSCYKLHTTVRTWSKAFMVCTAEGGHLAIINSETESTVLKDLFERYPTEKIHGYAERHLAFIGFHGWNENGDWRTLHDQSLTEAGFNRFHQNEPNNASTGEYCGAIYRDALLDDLWCENSYAFICEKNPKTLVNG